MKSLIESILSSTKSGKSELIWNKYAEYLSNLKMDYHYRGVTWGTTYLPGIKEKVNIDKVFLFDINRRRESRNDKAIKKLLLDSGYESAIHKFHQFDIDLDDIKENVYYDNIEEHNNKYSAFLVFKIDDTIICHSKESDVWGYCLSIYIMKNKKDIDDKKFEQLKKEARL